MLTNLFIFSLKASLVLAVLYLAYFVLFKRNTHFGMRRVLLLSMVVATLALPGIQLKIQTEVLPKTPVVQKVETLPYLEQAEVIISKERYNRSSEAKVYTPVEDVAHNLQKGQLNVVDMAVIVYLMGMAVMVLLLLFEMCRIMILAASGPKRHDLERNIIAHRWVKAPFSFARWIFIPENSSYDEETWQLIHWHEEVHLKQFHSLDVLISALLRCLLWFNPAVHLLHREIKDNHESLADRSVLKRVNMATYSQALLKVCLQTGSLNLGHGFALKSNLSKRIRAMQSNKTSFLKSFAAIMLFSIIGLGIFSQTSLYSQKSNLIRPTREDFVSGKFKLPMGFSYLAPRYQKVLDKLKALHPGKEFRWQYMSEGKPELYNDRFFDYRENEYFGKLNDEDKKQIFELIMNDSARLAHYAKYYSLTKEDIRNLAHPQVQNSLNYLVIYQPLEPEDDEDRRRVFEMDEVDAAPMPIGGLEAFERAVALDAEIPEGIDKADLPEKIEFSFIVHGGARISNLNLETELEGSNKKNLPIYRFFGSIHKNLLTKIHSYYSWQKGIKDGKRVNVRMVVSIPTKYM